MRLEANAELCQCRYEGWKHLGIEAKHCGRVVFVSVYCTGILLDHQIVSFFILGLIYSGNSTLETQHAMLCTIPQLYQYCRGEVKFTIRNTLDPKIEKMYQAQNTQTTSLCWSNNVLSSMSLQSRENFHGFHKEATFPNQTMFKLCSHCPQQCGLHYQECLFFWR